jgi:hypothetical protein
MRATIAAVTATVLVSVLGGAWMFRYELLAPVVYPGFLSIDNPSARPAVVVCTADRWTRNLICERVGPIVPAHVRQGRERPAQ